MKNIIIKITNNNISNKEEDNNKLITIRTIIIIKINKRSLASYSIAKTLIIFYF